MTDLYSVQRSPDFETTVEDWLRANRRDEGGFLAHQRTVAQFLDPSTPYRGLVLLHSLGSGKTCAAMATWITFAKSPHRKNLRVVAPASIRGPFVDTMLRCGEVAWEKDSNGRWSPADEGRATSDLSDEELVSLKASLATNPDGSDVFISSNGLVPSVTSKFWRGKRNAFDDSLIVIDEAHNLSRTLANAGDSSDSGSSQLYRAVVSAERSKVILMTGTPVQNVPVEIAYLVNMVAGITKEFVFRWSRPMNGDDLVVARRRVAAEPIVDRFLATSTSLSVTFAPDGFRMTPRGLQSSAPMSDSDRFTAIERLLIGFGDCRYSHVRKVELMDTDVASFNDSFVNPDGSLRNASYFRHLVTGLVSVYRAPDDGRFARVRSNESVILPMSAMQFKAYEQARRYERELDRKREVEDSDVSVYRHFSRTVSNFAFPRTHGAGTRLMRFQMERVTDKKYSVYTSRFVKLLASEGWLAGDRLGSVSPKFASIMERVGRSPSLVFSSFRSVEGLGLFSLALEANGWVRLTLSNVASVRKDKPVFIFPDFGDKKDLDLVRAFNDDRSSMTAAFREKWGDGFPILAVLLSKSGSEGINLKGVRQVHVMEPHWNNVLLEQVVGRAVRLGSHAHLPEDERTVDVYTYMCTFPGPQAAARLSEDKGVSTDEHIRRLAEIKARAGDTFAKALENSSIDCSFRNGAGEECRRTFETLDERAERAKFLTIGDARVVAFGDAQPSTLYDSAIWVRDGLLTPVASVDTSGNVTWF